MKQTLKKLSFYIFKIASRFGIYILPTHYYVPVSNVNELEKTRQYWAFKSRLPGIASDLDTQENNLKEICLPYRKEYAKNKIYKEAVQNYFGPGYGPIEAQALHGFIRYYKPTRIFEVGSGVSTYCTFQALEKNRLENGKPFDVTCIEPYPSDQLKKFTNIELIESPVQKIPFEKFNELQAGDLLFIDSSHTVRPGGDVNYLILEVLPRLSAGVFIHFHDIFLPYDYPRNVLSSYFQWMETSLLRAYLVNNNKVRIIFSLSQLHYDRKELLHDLFPGYKPAPDVNGLEVKKTKNDNLHFPASIFLQVL